MTDWGMHEGPRTQVPAEHRLPAGAKVFVTVVCHHPWGIGIRLADGTQYGHVDVSHLSGTGGSEGRKTIRRCARPRPRWVIGWADVDLEAGVVRVRQQLQRVGGSLRTAPVKTRAGNRDLPIGRAWHDTGLVFTTRSGLPVEPGNLARSFRRICDDHEIRVIKIHDLRHTTASPLKELHVPAKDTQMILGHAHVSTTKQIYAHVDDEARHAALIGLSDLLSSDD